MPTDPTLPPHSKAGGTGPVHDAGHPLTVPTNVFGGESADADRLPRVSGYEIGGELGRGGMGVVYQARQPGLGRTVALKMLLGGPVSEKLLIRFLAEAEAIATVRHANVLQVFEYGETDGRPFMALEFCPGGSLADRLKAGVREDPRAVAELIAKVAAGVAAAHEHGIVHRDLKPGNVLFDADGEPRVADFGIAKHAARDLTATQAVMGTPAYMSPEQAGGKAKFVGPQSDVWALGVMLYECLTGRRPFEGETTSDILNHVMLGDPTPPREHLPTLPRDLDAICLRCLERDPTRRYPTAAELAEELTRFLAGEPITSLRSGLVARIADSLDRVRLHEQFAAYGTLLLVLAPVMLLPEVCNTLVVRYGWPLEVHIAVSFGRVAAFLLAVGYFRDWHYAPRGPHERQLWAVWCGYLLACFGAGTSNFLASDLPDPDKYRTDYPALANLTALAFFALAPTIWGYCAVIGLGFIGLAFVMAADLRWAPLEFGTAWAVVLVLLGLRLRGLGRSAGAVASGDSRTPATAVG